MRSDLVLEATEAFFNSSESEEKDITGVKILENVDTAYHIKITDVSITNREGEKKIGKPIGKYITVEAKDLANEDDDYHLALTKILMEQLKKMLPSHLERYKILVAGIGNKQITPDAVGPLVVEHLFITRHLFKEYGEDSVIVKGMGNLSAIIPGVMAQTGMETAEILRGLIKETKPDILIAIDALAARNMRRLITTIQLTDTGIHPGAGIGNRRYALTEETLGIPVIAIGIPTVIDAATIVTDAMDRLFQALEGNQILEKAIQATEQFEHEEKYLLMRELMEPQMRNFFVTPKDIDVSVERVSYTISEAINSLCHQI